MLFNSVEFPLFFVAVLVLYWRLPHRGQNVFLLGASYFFYGCWDYRFLSLILLSTVVDYVCGLRMGATDEQRSRTRSPSESGAFM